MHSATTATPLIRLFLTQEHRCGYFADRLARNIVLDPDNPELGSAYANALAAGFRRSAGHLYRPRCAGCQACIATRLPVACFAPDRSQKRCWQRNADLAIDVEPARFDEELYRLYRRYLEARHPDAVAIQGEPDDLRALFDTPWANSHVLCIRRGEQLLAAAVTDRLTTGLSAVYTFFDPNEQRRSLGVFAVLAQIDWARRENLPYLFLGFWIDGHPKMGYKSRFQPLQMQQDRDWQPQRPALPTDAGVR